MLKKMCINKNKLISKYKLLIIVFLSCLGSCGAYLYLNKLNPSLRPNYSILFFLFWLSHFMVWQKASLKISWGLILLVMLYGCCLTLGLNYNTSDIGILSVKKIIFLIIALGCFIYPFLQLLTDWIDRQNNKRVKPANRKGFIICFILVAIFWIIGFLAAFPGIYAADGPYIYARHDSAEFIESKLHQVDSHHSPLYGFIFHAIVSFGFRYFGSYQVGFALYSFIQMSFCLICIFGCLKFLGRYNRFLLYGATTFFILNPLFLLLSISSIQDSIFSALFILLLIYLIRFIEEPEKIKRHKVQIFIYIIIVTLFCLFRNNGIYALIPFILFAILLLKKDGKLIFCYTLIPIIIALSIKGPFYDALNIKKTDGINEMMSMPVQQIGYSKKYNSKSFSVDDSNALSNFFTNNCLNFYASGISDNLKNVSCLKPDYLKNHIWEFAGLYLKIGIKNVGNYFKASLLQTIGLWYTDKTYPDYRMYHNLVEYSDFLISFKKFAPNIKHESLIPPLHNFYANMFEDVRYGEERNKIAFIKVPFLAILCRLGFYTWLLLYTAYYLIRGKKKKQLVILSFLFFLAFTVFLSPVMLLRYYLPILMATPIIIYLLIKK